MAAGAFNLTFYIVPSFLKGTTLFVHLARLELARLSTYAPKAYVSTIPPQVHKTNILDLYQPSNIHVPLSKESVRVFYFVRLSFYFSISKNLCLLSFIKDRYLFLMSKCFLFFFYFFVHQEGLEPSTRIRTAS